MGLAGRYKLCTALLPQGWIADSAKGSGWMRSDEPLEVVSQGFDRQIVIVLIVVFAKIVSRNPSNAPWSVPEEVFAFGAPLSPLWQLSPEFEPLRAKRRDCGFWRAFLAIQRINAWDLLEKPAAAFLCPLS